ncbi:dTDP-glucose 4,6-dehydratase [hydrothermal vent metagenome]|uniref:dTDP-glucose 4,6-dehydratase n=1 Tax=hydrothermal vent metagenome TaxID=652676 RepID=A0A3B1CAT0_9ZZZZ
MKTILVTGGAGFIGGNFTLGLVQTGHARIINLDALTYAGNMDTLSPIMDNPAHIFVKGDIRDGDLIAKLLNEHKPDAIINFAAESHVDRSIDEPAVFIQTNVLGTHTLLETALKYWSALDNNKKANFRFLHVSTDEVYGSLGATGKFTEETPYAPNSPYAASKASADHLVRAFGKTYGLPTLTTNCSNNYGPYQFPEKLIPLVIQKAISGEPIPVYGDGKQVRDWLFVADHCKAIFTVLEKGKPGEVYNIGGDMEKTNIEVIETICNILDNDLGISPEGERKTLILFVKDRPGHDRRYAINFSKISRELGWSPDETFDSGMKKTVRWYLSNKTWVERVMSGAYMGERLGLGK